MKARTFYATTIVITCTLISTAAYAAIMPMSALPQARFATKIKMVKFAIRNDSKTSVELKVGEQVITVRSGQTINMSAPVGAQIVRTQAIADHPAGEVLAIVLDFLGDATVVVNT